MPRIQLQEITPKDFFEKIKITHNLSYTQLAALVQTNKRNLSSWALGKTHMPIEIFLKLIDFVKSKPKFTILPDYWHTKDAGRKGGLILNQLYGNPGTIIGRKKGGRNSYRNFLSNPTLTKKTGFILAKEVHIPPLSKELAEFIGIILGDGTIANYQINITLNRYVDTEYSKFVTELTKKLFEVQPSVYNRLSVINIVISRVLIIRYLLKHHLKIGNKVKNQIQVPKWIYGSPQYIKACIRGLLDTDGCFYTDKHSYKNKIYLNPALNFTNRSLPLLKFFKTSLEKFGFHPTQTTKFSIFLRKENEIINFFREIGSSNPKHIKKFEYFLKEKRGEVPKWS